MSKNSPIRILLVDDHDMVRSGLSVFLLAYEDFKLVGEAVNGQEALDKCADLHPDVILMDLIMPVMDGITATRLIRERFRTLRSSRSPVSATRSWWKQPWRRGRLAICLKMYRSMTWRMPSGRCAAGSPRLPGRNPDLD
jgi:CheY-like chemotaxis protein